MKLIKNIAILLAGVSVAFSCSTDLETTKIASSDQYVSPTLNAVGNVVVNQDNNSVEAVTFTWSSATVGAPTQIEYSLYLSANGTTALAGSSYSNSLSLSKADLNGIVCNDLGVAKNSSATVEAYVEAGIYNSDIVTLKSNSISFNISTYAAQLRQYFICGEFQTWTIASAPSLWETDGGTNIYKTLIDLDNSANSSRNSDDYSYFKITAAQDWNHDNWGYNYLTPAWTCPDDKDSNLSIPVAEGTINFLTVNVGKMTITKEAVSEVDLIGDFDESNGWGNDVKFTYSAADDVWTAGPVTFTSGTGFLVRLNASWDGAYKYGDGTKASDAVSGGYELVNDGSAANINVPSTGTYVMKLYANRTPFVLVMDKQ